MRNNRTSHVILVPIAVPVELLAEIDLDPMDAIQMSVDNGRLVIEKLTDDDFECDEDCANYPFEEACDGECEDCPCLCQYCGECIRELDEEDDYE